MYGEGYLDWAEEEVRDFFSGVGKILFVPYALHDLDGYAKTARERFARWEIEVISAHEHRDPAAVAAQMNGIFVGGGNTFRLLTRLYETGLFAAIRERVLSGAARYMGSSAGTNIATPSIRTTNDMPIVYPPTFDALNLVPFQINPHYLDPEPGLRHMGETREARIREYLEMNETPVVGLREGSWIRVEGESAVLGGRHPARIFRRGSDPTEHPIGSRLELALATGKVPREGEG